MIQESFLAIDISIEYSNEIGDQANINLCPEVNIVDDAPRCFRQVRPSSAELQK